jgi:hypothetical protein
MGGGRLSDYRYGQLFEGEAKDMLPCLTEVLAKGGGEYEAEDEDEDDVQADGGRAARGGTARAPPLAKEAGNAAPAAKSGAAVPVHFFPDEL